MIEENNRRRFHGRRLSRPIPKSKRDLMANTLPHLAVTLPDEGKPFELRNLFAHDPKEVWLEIGFGGGEHIAARAAQNPDVGLIGAEPFMNGVASLVYKISEENIQNIRIYPDDVRLLLEKIPQGALSRIFILFPDPWPKARHHKRRIIQQNIIPVLSKCLKADGVLTIATDHADYREWILEIMDDQSYFVEALGDRKDAFEQPEDWVQTRYQTKAIREGRKSTFMIYENKR